jgi:catechol 2,3-dioxygenase-like lactoylglutathione lyase family enzyme
MPLYYASLKVSDIARSASFYDAVLAPLGWRRQEDGPTAIGWGLIRAAEFFITRDESQRPGFGLVSFPAKSIPAVKASYASGIENGGQPAAEPGSSPSHGSGSYAARVLDPDGYLVEIAVVND